MVPPSRFLVLDLGDVLFHYNALGLTEFPRKHFGTIITSPEWAALERGEIDHNDALQRLASRPDIPLTATQIESGLAQCRKSLSLDVTLVKLLAEFKNKMKNVGGGLKFYAMTNVSEFDFTLMGDVLSANGMDWSFFDGVFTSFGAHMRKPEARFYEHVIAKLGARPQDMVFVDDKVENVNAANAAGMHGLGFTGRAKLIHQLHLMFLDSRVLGGKTWLKEHARELSNEIEGEEKFEDAFSQFLIMEATKDSSLLYLNSSLEPHQETDADIQRVVDSGRQWNYFIRKPVGTTYCFPNDVDTTACSLLAFTPQTGANEVLDSMLANRTADGFVQTYWDPTRPRIDCCVLTNVIRAFYKYQRGGDIKESLAYVVKALLGKDYISGTRHYCTPETFLFYVAQLVSSYPQEPELQALQEPLAMALAERVGVYANTVTQAELDLEAASKAMTASDTTGAAKKKLYKAYVPEVDSLAIAMRVLGCQLLNIRPNGYDKDILRLTEMQCEDGSWPIGWVCRYGRTKARIGNRGVVTAFAAKALETEAMVTADGVDVTGLEEDEQTGYKIKGAVAGSSKDAVSDLVSEDGRTRADSLMKDKSA